MPHFGGLAPLPRRLRTVINIALQNDRSLARVVIESGAYVTKLQTRLIPANDAVAAQAASTLPSAPDFDSAPALPADLPRPKKTRRLAISLAVLAGDIMAITLAFVLVSLIRFDGMIAGDTTNMLVAILPVYLGTALNSNAYDTRAVSQWRMGMYRATTSLLFTSGAAILAVFFLKATGDFSRLVFGCGVALAFVLLVVQRFVFSRVARRALGSSALTEIIIRDNVDIDASGGRFVIDAKRYRLAPAIDDPVMMDRLGCVLKTADRVIVACAPKDRQRWALALKGADVNAEVLAPELDAIGPLQLGRLGGRTTLQVATGRLGITDRTLKRMLDLALTIAAMPVLAPIMAVIAIAVKLDSPGPVFFVQKRIGQGNRMFNMYKFRSMRVELLDNTGSRSASRDDDRITRVGRIIRRTSMDELPQILNVLFGSMSIVGPRPHALASKAENLLFWDIDHRYWDRHAMKPGLTGLAQIRGFRGATNHQSDLKNRLQADLEYLSGWTVWRDIAIILSTFRVLVHRNAF